MPRVHEVKLPARDLVGGDVVTLDVHSGVDVVGEPGDVDVGGEYMPALPDAAGQPVGNSGAACPDLPASPPTIDTQRFEVPEAHGVKEGGKRVQALVGVFLGECIATALHSDDPTLNRLASAQCGPLCSF